MLFNFILSTVCEGSGIPIWGLGKQTQSSYVNARVIDIIEGLRSGVRSFVTSPLLIRPQLYSPFQSLNKPSQLLPRACCCSSLFSDTWRALAPGLLMDVSTHPGHMGQVSSNNSSVRGLPCSPQRELSLYSAHTGIVFVPFVTRITALR